MKPELIVALDVPVRERMPEIVDNLPATITHYKIGLELFVSEGPAVLDYFKKKSKKVFLDLKLHDIPRTVAHAVAAAARHDVAMLSIHAGGGRDMLKAAVNSAGEQEGRAPKLVAVTTLTSLNGEDLRAMGVSRSVAAHTVALGEMAVSVGVDGLVCSPLEARVFRQKMGGDPILVTPGIRPSDSETGDQKRFATPRTAVEAGADFLVVGRPILQAPDARKAAEEILRQMNAVKSS